MRREPTIRLYDNEWQTSFHITSKSESERRAHKYLIRPTHGGRRRASSTFVCLYMDILCDMVFDIFMYMYIEVDVREGGF